MQEELRIALPQLSQRSTRLPANAQTGRERRPRRIRRTGTDGRRSQDIKVRLTSFDGPNYTSTAQVNLAALREKGLGRISDSTDSWPIEWGTAEIQEFILSKFPPLDGLAFDVLIGKRGCKLHEIEPLTSMKIRELRGQRGVARLWVRPTQRINHYQMDTPTILATARVSRRDLPNPPTYDDTIRNRRDSLSPERQQDMSPLSPQRQAAIRNHQETNSPERQRGMSPPSPQRQPASPPLSPQRQPASPPLSPQRQPESLPTSPQRQPASPPLSPQRQPASPPLSPDPDLSLELLLDVTDSDITNAIGRLQRRLGGETQPIVVRRAHILDDLLVSYKHIDVTGNIEVIYDDESGVDQGGLTKDTFSLFWEKASERHFKGRDCIVPNVSVHQRSLAKNIFPVLGKIMEHQLCVVGYLPPQLCRSCVLVMAHPEQEVDSELLVEDFIRFLSEADSFLVEKCLDSPSWSSSDTCRLRRLFSIKGLAVLPSASNLRESLINMAQTELLDSCYPFLMMMRKGISDFALSSFFEMLDCSKIRRLYEDLSSTPETVAQLIDDFYLRADQLSALQEVVVSHLSNCIREMDKRQLMRFLRWLTGSTAMPTLLTVMFNASVGMRRVPVAHTCGNLIELSTQYESYEDFKRELLVVIESDEAFVFSIQ